LSDIDILVEWEKPTFDHYFDLKFFLEDTFGWKVDLVVAEAIKPAFKDYILAEVVYAA
jgi:predicted nucleotidyltransferase